MKIKKCDKIWKVRVPWKFLICVLGTLLLCGFSRFYGNAGSTEEVSLYAWLHYSREELLLMGEQASAYFVMISFSDMEWFMVLLPLLAAFPTVTDFAEQWFGGYYYPSISRKTRKRYAAEWMLRAALRGFFCIVTGIFIYFILVYCKFPHYGEFGVDANSSMIAMAYGANAGKRLAVLLIKVLHTGLLAAVLAMCAVLLVALCKDGFFAISSLVLTEYFSKKLHSAYEGELIVRYFNRGKEEPMLCKIIRFFFPSNHLYYDQTFYVEYGIGYWLYLIFIGLLIAGIFLWFYRLVKRRNG